MLVCNSLGTQIIGVVFQKQAAPSQIFSKIDYIDAQESFRAKVNLRKGFSNSLFPDVSEKQQQLSAVFPNETNGASGSIVCFTFSHTFMLS